MKNQIYWALGVLVLLIIVVGMCYLVGNPFVEAAEDTVDTSSESEQLETQASVKMPPPGESIATGHWEGDVWKRTVPPEPDTLIHEGKPMTLRELLRASYDSTDSWEEEVAILNRIIKEAPYSEEAYSARNTLARKDENGEAIRDDALLFERLQPLLNYHPDNPSLLSDLLMCGKDIHPETAIRYGTEAFKYVGRYRMDSLYGAYPEQIHYYLGYAYQVIGDYDTALGHLDQALILYLRVRKAGYLNREIRGHPPPGQTFATGYWGDNKWHRTVPKDPETIQIEQIHKENTISDSSSDEPVLAEKMARKLPPPGETSITGYWDGDTWHRTVPKDPETITFEGKALPLRKLYRTTFYFEKSWEEKVVILNLIIAEAPYSQEALEARYYLARRDENGEVIHDDALVLERLENRYSNTIPTPQSCSTLYCTIQGKVTQKQQSGMAKKHLNM